MRAGLLGRKLGHSFSPRLHGFFGDYDYQLFELEPNELEDFMTSGRFDALNVTIPYKKSVIPYCAELSETARNIGSVNTLVRRPDGSLLGDNTDAAGFAAMLAGGASPVEAAQIANLCSAVTIKKLGTTGTAAREEVLAAYDLYFKEVNP